MNEIFTEISSVLSKVRWGNVRGKRRPSTFRIGQEWPLAEALEKMMKTTDPFQRPVGMHVRGVIASINELMEEPFQPSRFFIDSKSSLFNQETRRLASIAYNFCWGGGEVEPLFGSQRAFSESFLRVAALYHDIGKSITIDRHVSRGVHLMRDVQAEDRRAMESLFANLAERRCFWRVIRHHDLFGCLCTGEASLPALANIIDWTTLQDPRMQYASSAIAHASYLLWLNIADVNAVLANVPNFGGITTIEAQRYLVDWSELREYLVTKEGKSRPVTRSEFRSWAFEIESHPERAIRRITRLVALCYRKAFHGIDHDKEREIQSLVEERLQASQGPRFEWFCFRLARLCKFEYALRFFEQLMGSLLNAEPGLANRIEELNQKPPDPELQQAEQTVLRNMVMITCAIISRVVEEYGHLIDYRDRSKLRIGVDFSNLTTPKETGVAICESIRADLTSGIWWIIDEIDIWLYRD